MEKELTEESQLIDYPAEDWDMIEPEIPWTRADQERMTAIADYYDEEARGHVE